MASSTRFLVWSLTGFARTKFDTVMTDTPASFATSLSVARANLLRDGSASRIPFITKLHNRRARVQP